MEKTLVDEKRKREYDGKEFLEKFKNTLIAVHIYFILPGYDDSIPKGKDV